MATQTHTQESVKREQLRHRRRAKERPDALVNQFSNVLETYPSAEQNDTMGDWNNEAAMTLRDTAQALARIDRAMWVYLAKFMRNVHRSKLDLQALPLSNGLTVSEWGELIEKMVSTMGKICIYGANNLDVFLRASDAWGQAELIFSQVMEGYGGRDLESSNQFVDSLCVHNVRHSMLISDLLPRLVELNQYDVQMHAAFRRRWTYIDLILDRWFGGERRDRCDVPYWLVKADFRGLLQRSLTEPRHEISQLFKPTKAKEKGELPTRLNQVSSTLWLSLPIFLTTIPTTALGWQHSPHQPGTTQDADFWFSVQSSCMTILGFAVLAIPIWRSEAFSVKARFWVWGLLIAASLCVTLSPLMYIFGLTEWSQFMSIVAGIVQVFLTLQIALIADSAGKRGSKSGKKDK